MECRLASRSSSTSPCRQDCSLSLPSPCPPALPCPVPVVPSRQVSDPSLLRFLVDMRGADPDDKQLRDDLMTMLIAGE